jgi:hypothetical protein
MKPTSGIPDAGDLPPIGPQHDQPFVPRPGCYVCAMWSLPMPDLVAAFGMGGDVTFQLWRKESEPDKWKFTFRYRHFRDNKVFGSSDLRRWHEWSMHFVNETEARKKVDEALKLIQTQFRIKEEPDCLPIGGGINEFLAAIERDKPHWMHLQVIQNE